MAQAEAFETEFWKDANLPKMSDDIVPADPRQHPARRKMRDDIGPGELRKTLPYTLTREAIELYCQSVGEDHPLYFDEAYAKTTRYGGPLAPPSTQLPPMF